MEGWIISLIFIIFVFMFITILAVYHLPNSGIVKKSAVEKHPK